jgi:hypothetical protein
MGVGNIGGCLGSLNFDIWLGTLAHRGMGSSPDVSRG